MTREELIIELKIKVTYKQQLRQHYYGKNELSNAQLRSLCSEKLGNKYDNLPKPEKRKFIDKMFIELRGENIE